MTTLLGPQQWIDAALSALAADGVDAVRVERLAATLKVTKGSFYWHFPNRGALLDAILDAWKTQATAAIIADVETRGGAARAKLLHLISRVFIAHGTLDRQIRAWATNDARARTALDEIDQSRLNYLALLFDGAGFSPSQSRIRARFAYHALIGRFTMGTTPQSPRSREAEIQLIFQMLIAPS